jgi:hypothetical protein
VLSVEWNPAAVAALVPLPHWGSGDFAAGETEQTTADRASCPIYLHGWRDRTK